MECNGNRSAVTLKAFIETNGLTEDDWKVNELNNFYFDCAKHKKAFKLDPVRVEGGGYSD